MLENSDISVDSSSEPSVEPWPRPVAWLAVLAHFCVADVIGVTRAKGDLDVVRDAAVLLAQADLIVVWLVLGGSRSIRRVPWSLCGLSGVGLVLYMHIFREVVDVILFVYILHVLITAAAAWWLRFPGMRIVHNRGEVKPSIEERRRRHQFSILDLFGAALAVAIAVSWMIRMQRPTSFLNDVGVLGMLSAAVAPLALFTLLAVAGLQRDRWLVAQMALSAFLAIFVPNLLRNDIAEQVCLLYSIHWFLVAATLWIFQMCGYRLVRTTATDDGNGTSSQR